MTISRIPFDSRFAGAETLAVCVLVAGVPLVLVPSGLALALKLRTDFGLTPPMGPDIRNYFDGQYLGAAAAK